MTIGLLILAQNEEHCIHLPIENLKDHVNSITVIDDHSTDETVAIASSFGARTLTNKIDPHIYGFSEVYNWAMSKIKEDWILIIDADEILDKPHLLHELTRHQNVTAWELPRRKWLDYKQSQRLEYEAYPDWQSRFFRNIPENRFKGELHKTFMGNTTKAHRGPHIEHLQVELSNKHKDKYRIELYDHLADIQGVARERGHRRSR